MSIIAHIPHRRALPRARTPTRCATHAGAAEGRAGRYVRLRGVRKMREAPGHEALAREKENDVNQGAPVLGFSALRGLRARDNRGKMDVPWRKNSPPGILSRPGVAELLGWTDSDYRTYAARTTSPPSGRDAARKATSRPVIE